MSGLGAGEGCQFVVQRVIGRFKGHDIEERERADRHTLLHSNLLDTLRGHALTQEGHRLVQITEQRLVVSIKRL